MNLIEEENKKQPSPEGAEALRIAEKNLDELYNVDETTEVETVVNTIGGAVDVAQLGVEISETQKNSIDYWVGVLNKDEDKTVDQVEKEDSKEKLQALTIIYNAVAVDLIGSYRDAARHDLAPEWKTE